MHKSLDEVQTSHSWTSQVGLECIALRAAEPHLSHWRGYVVVPARHVFHGKDYDQCILRTPCDEPYCGHGAESMLDVHGGVTFAGRPRSEWEFNDQDVWLLGFDYAHADDDPSFGGSVKDLDYVIAECERLAEQLV